MAIRPSRSAHQRHGFSLVELLVVVTVIAILASLLVPVIAMVRDQAKSTVCQSNLRQIAMAYVAYTSDNKGHLPNSNLGNNRNQPNPAQLDGYIPTTFRAWQCTNKKLSGSGFKFYVHWLLHSTNCATWLYPGKNYVNVAWVAHPTEAYIMGDLDDAARGGYHRARANAAMLDGHVLNRVDKSMSIDYYTQAIIYADPGQTMWNEHGATGAKGLKGYKY